jgi:hypothetical protein
VAARSWRCPMRDRGAAATQTAMRSDHAAMVRQRGRAPRRPPCRKEQSCSPIRGSKGRWGHNRIERFSPDRGKTPGGRPRMRYYLTLRMAARIAAKQRCKGGAIRYPLSTRGAPRQAQGHPRAAASGDEARRGGAWASEESPGWRLCSIPPLHRRRRREGRHERAHRPARGQAHRKFASLARAHPAATACRSFRRERCLIFVGHRMRSVLDLLQRHPGGVAFTPLSAAWRHDLPIRLSGRHGPTRQPASPLLDWP